MATHRSRRLATAFLALASVALAGLVSAADFGLSMTRVHLDAKHPVETIAITNRDAEQVAFEVQVKRWRQDASGAWQLVPDDSLVVHPLIVKIPAGEVARVRIGSLSPSVTEEQAYRVELSELPDRTKQKAGMIRMLARISLPVFVQVAEPKQALSLSVDTLAGRDGTLLLRNSGTGYAAPEEATLRTIDAAGKTLHETHIATPYVLAGAQSPMKVALSGGDCAHAAKIELVMPNTAPLAATVAPGARRCAP